MQDEVSQVERGNDEETPERRRPGRPKKVSGQPKTNAQAHAENTVTYTAPKASSACRALRGGCSKEEAALASGFTMPELELMIRFNNAGVGDAYKAGAPKRGDAE